MPAANIYRPNPDRPLDRNRPVGGWLDPPVHYYVRAADAETALSLVLYCAYVKKGEIPAKYAGRVATAKARLSGPRSRTFKVAVGRKPDERPDQIWMASEIEEIFDWRDHV